MANGAGYAAMLSQAVEMVFSLTDRLSSSQLMLSHSACYETISSPVSHQPVICPHTCNYTLIQNPSCTSEPPYTYVLTHSSNQQQLIRPSKCNAYTICRQTQLSTRWYANLLNTYLHYMFRPQSLAIIRLYKRKLINYLYMHFVCVGGDVV